MSNVSAWNKIYSSYVNFNGRYRMTMDTKIVDPGSGIAIIKLVDYGTHIQSFRAYPAF